MPSNVLYADTLFPDLGSDGSPGEKFEKISSYLFMLLEQLRYSFANLGEENFNVTEFKNITETIQNGMVKFVDLSTSGSTTICGDNIRTGTISAINISGCDVEGSTFRSILYTNGVIGGEFEMCYSSRGSVAGGIRLDDKGAGTDQENKYRMFVYTNTCLGIPFSLKLQSAGSFSTVSDTGHVYVQAAKDVILTGSNVRLTGKSIYLNGDVYINDVLYTPPTDTAE